MKQIIASYLIILGISFFVFLNFIILTARVYKISAFSLIAIKCICIMKIKPNLEC